MPLSAGNTVSVSLPSASVLKPTPSVYTFPLTAILVGAPLLVIAAVPPETDNTKSLTAIAPLPPFVLYTASLIVTAIVLLSAAKETDEIVAGN